MQQELRETSQLHILPTAAKQMPTLTLRSTHPARALAYFPLHSLQQSCKLPLLCARDLLHQCTILSCTLPLALVRSRTSQRLSLLQTYPCSQGLLELLHLRAIMTDSLLEGLWGIPLEPHPCQSLSPSVLAF
jgi:hypothetical protein